MKTIGLDVGSTTLKCVVMDECGQILYHSYQRHRSKASELTAALLRELSKKFAQEKMGISISGSAGMGIAAALNLPFVQEVYATRAAVQKKIPGTDVVIELGGEDAKILFLTNGTEVRMNGTCAGGTGAFIDQMASLMAVESDEMNTLAQKHEKIYTIASRCGVFAKSDIQPLLNQGARKEDVSASIFYAVVNQVIAGLAQGREIVGNVLYLGGPLTFFSELRAAFDDVLKLSGTCPEYSLYYVALGAALSAVVEPQDLHELASRVENAMEGRNYQQCEPLFSSKAEYQAFLNRHEEASRGFAQLLKPDGEFCLGIDAGSTTVKVLLCDCAGNVFHPMYCANSGNPVPLVRAYLDELYRQYPNIQIRGAAVTGYGEEMIRNAFHVDFGIVETIAHYTSAKRFCPDVDFILDIGGQDIKCFQIRNGVIDNIYLNEACSSGCGSFLQTFAGALNYTAENFSKLALFATKPVDLGCRCTVFMNSAVKQAQKDGASIADISAGLSISVVKNALYKVIRCAKAEDLGKKIVVQGGTFLNDAVLRAFEKEIGHDVIRPKFAPVMGALGAALYAWEHCGTKSTILNAEQLCNFRHDVKATTCQGCSNHCRLTINNFGDGRRYVAGNRCDRPVSHGHSAESYDLFAYKNELLMQYRRNEVDPNAPTIGIPMGLNLYELLPFWYTFFRKMGFNVVVSPVSSHKLYLQGQHTIPSDTICYPAKLLHGHIEALLQSSVDAIFYPSMTYNVDEKKGNNHFNCPVVAYYPQVLKSNIPALEKVPYICDFIGLHHRAAFQRRMSEILSKYFPNVSKKPLSNATKAAYAELEHYHAQVREKGQEFRQIAKEKGLQTIVLCGRPYHIDPEISHGISSLICRLGAVVLTEDSICDLVGKFPVGVRNQWTYHARMYRAAKVVAEAKDDPTLNLVQLVSFGCGVDAVTTDEVKSIVEDGGKIYTQIKIDEISNMGAITIRLRSLFSALEDRRSATQNAEPVPII